jgi:hypothetical protein
MLDTVYNVAGAATGAVKGVAEVSKREAQTATSSMTAHALATLSYLQKAVTARARNTANKLYSVAGALSGVVNGAKYAGLSLWWSVTDDEFKIKLIQGSPVKYKLKDLESLVQNQHYTHGLPGQYNNGNGVSLGAPVTSSNDHLAAQNQQQKQQEESRRRNSEDVGNSVDKSLEAVVNKAASKTATNKNTSTTTASSRLHPKKKTLPSTPQQDDYSPRVLA